MESIDTTILHIGFDDTDSLSGSCTTFLALNIIESISQYVEYLDYPRLIRNNPNIPWKTRGNGAIALSIKIKDEFLDSIIDTTIRILDSMHEKDHNTNPGIVFIKGEIPDKLIQFSKKALTEVISIETAEKLAKEISFKYCKIGNGRGLIGGLAAVGNALNPDEEDFTYELLTYRTNDCIGTKRKLDETSVALADKKYSPNTFNNIDDENKKVLIAPAGLDPIFFGIRGEDPSLLLNMLDEIEVYEPLFGYCIFRTNQGTDQHFKYSTSTIRDYCVFKGSIEVTSNPQTNLGGHVIFRGRVDGENKEVDIAAFEPTKGFRKVIRKLRKGDKILAFGGVRFKNEFQNYTIQLEKCEILFVSEQFKLESPFCPSCKKRLISDGHNKGYKCRNCGYKNRELNKVKTPVARDLSLGIYIPPAQSQRHLVKPHRRYKIPPKTDYNIIDKWWRIKK